jgi:hypothetical protein
MWVRRRIRRTKSGKKTFNAFELFKKGCGRRGLVAQNDYCLWCSIADGFVFSKMLASLQKQTRKMCSRAAYLREQGPLPN